MEIQAIYQLLQLIMGTKLSITLIYKDNSYLFTEVNYKHKLRAPLDKLSTL